MTLEITTLQTIVIFGFLYTAIILFFLWMFLKSDIGRLNRDLEYFEKRINERVQRNEDDIYKIKWK